MLNSNDLLLTASFTLSPMVLLGFLLGIGEDTFSLLLYNVYYLRSGLA